MNYKEFFKSYCPVYNWTNNKEQKIYCNPHCPHFLGLSKGKFGIVALCETIEEKAYDKLYKQ